MTESSSSRRDFLKKTAYVAPLILTMNVSLAEANVGSSRIVDCKEDFVDERWLRIRRIGWNHWGDD